MLRIVVFGAVLLLGTYSAVADPVVIEVDDTDGAAARVAAPVSMAIDLEKQFGGPIDAKRLRLARQGSVSIPVQFVADKPGSSVGRLWWLTPPDGKGKQRFTLKMAEHASESLVEAQFDRQGKRVDVRQGDLPVLRFSHGTVPVPDGVPPHYARGDYINMLHGPRGELLTDDYPKDHPHHRGVSWSWPVTRWKDEVRDIWAVSGVWARPVAMRRVQSGPVVAVIEAESVWKWSDEQPIVREHVTIRAFRQTNGCRVVDVEVQLTAMTDGVAIGGRPSGGYGGFGLRAAEVAQQKITSHTDPAESAPRRAWLDYSGRFVGGKDIAGITILENTANPGYPNEWKEYPQLNYVMPAFPGEREVSLSQDKPLILKHRLWIHTGGADKATITDAWTAYATPPKVQAMAAP